MSLELAALAAMADSLDRYALDSAAARIRDALIEARLLDTRTALGRSAA